MTEDSQDKYAPGRLQPSVQTADACHTKGYNLGASKRSSNGSLKLYPSWVVTDKQNGQHKEVVSMTNFSGHATGITSGEATHSKNSRFLNRNMCASMKQALHVNQDS